MKKMVFVGLSGGVDSSVSAQLLKEQGYEVTGVFIRGWQPDWIPCTWKEDRISAMRTAAHLDIPFVTLDLEREYKDKVVTYLLEEYGEGRTPNPDMLCNREIKFGKFLSWAISMGADYVATGHYAQNINNEMYESNDKDKDQSYFLSQVGYENLKKIIFPIGHLQKSEVRKIAEKNNLPVATRKDSQGICFVGQLEMKDFLKKELNPAPGDVVDLNGKVIGKHDGAILYTIGERHGFEILNLDTKNSKHFVVKKDLDKNLIYVSDELRVEESYREKFIVSDFASLTEGEIEDLTDLSVRLRYRAKKILINSIKKMSNEKYEIILSERQNISPGQFAVLYKGEKCLGGGVTI